MSRSIVRAVAGLALIAAPAVVQAQTCTNTGGASATCNVVATASLTIPYIVSLDVGSTTITLNTPTWATFLAGAATQYTETVISVTRASNATYDVQISANAATFTNANGGARTAGTVSWTNASSCAAPGTALSTTPTDFVTGASAGSTTADLCFTTEFVTNLSNTMMRAGAHTLGVTFTIAAP
jgi:hypothetical protein